MDNLTHALTYISQRNLSPDFRLPPPPPACMHTVSIHLPTFLGLLGGFQVYMAQAHMQTAIIPAPPGILSVSARIPRLLSEKDFSLSENGQCRTMYKRHTNCLHADFRSLANRQFAGIQRKTSKTNRSRGLASDARPSPQKACKLHKVVRKCSENITETRLNDRAHT